MLQIMCISVAAWSGLAAAADCEDALNGPNAFLRPNIFIHRLLVPKFPGEIARLQTLDNVGSEVELRVFQGPVPAIEFNAWPSTRVARMDRAELEAVAAALQSTNSNLASILRSRATYGDVHAVPDYMWRYPQRRLPPFHWIFSHEERRARSTKLMVLFKH
ncbi:MAG: hypothetical protein HC902_01055 [Calothrix sp. SM1_5_4]|nr:hypothetical protein [Calothrix sp. SM1_5_4]